METKVCTKCGKSKSLDQFGKRKGTRDGHKTYCKECHYLHYVVGWRATGRGKQSAAKYSRAYYKTNRKELDVKNRVRTRERKIWLLNELGTLACSCGENHPACLDFHHLSDKKFNISTSIWKDKTKLLAEAKKCQVLCSNCHRKTHWLTQEVLDARSNKNTLPNGQGVS